MISWANPWILILLLPLGLVFYYLYQRKNSRRTSMVFSQLKIFREIKQGWRARLSYVPSVLKAAALVLIVFGLARPQSSDVRVKKNVEGIDIMVALDISASMLIEDMKPANRLEAAKEMIKDFVAGRISDRIGLVCFSGESYTRMPLTLDYEMLLETLGEVEVSEKLKLGTAIGVALANSVARLRESTAKSRVIILLTDGENNSGTIDPLTALDIAKGYGMRIYTIGIGKDGDAMLPVFVTDSRGRKRKTYQPIHSKVNDELLGKFAEETGGKYYRAVSGRGLKKVFANIDRLEKTKIEVQRFTRYKEHYGPYVRWALFLYALSMILAGTVLRREA